MSQETMLKVVGVLACNPGLHIRFHMSDTGHCVGNGRFVGAPRRFVHRRMSIGERTIDDLLREKLIRRLKPYESDLWELCLDVPKPARQPKNPMKPPTGFSANDVLVIGRRKHRDQDFP